MANVKQVTVQGWLPFNFHEDADLARRVAFVVCPSSGLTLRWDRRERYVPNKHGGKTAMYEFEVSGMEAVSFEWCDAFRAAVERVGGAVTLCDVDDLEGGVQ